LKGTENHDQNCLHVTNFFIGCVYVAGNSYARSNTR